MPRPESRDTGAPIQWFTASKPSKKDKGNWARQNEAAYNKANEQIMLWRAQYQRDFGRGVPSYATGRDIPPEEKTPYNMALKEVLDKEAAKKAKRDAKKIIETTVEPTAHEKTQKLKDQKAAIDVANKAIKEAGKTGGLKAEVEGVNKKDTRSNFAKFGGIVKDVAETALINPITKDVGGRILEAVGRPSNAVSSGVVKAAETPRVMDIPSDVRKKILAKGGPQAEALLASEADTKAKIASGEYKKVEGGAVPAEQTASGINTANIYAARRGLSGKEHHSVSEYTNPVLKKNVAALRDNPNDAWYQTLLKNAPGVGAGITVDVAGDPLNAVKIHAIMQGIGAVKNVRRGEEAVSGARAVHLAENAAGDSEKAARANITAKVAEQAPSWKAPLELEQTTQSTKAAQAAKHGFEFSSPERLAQREAEIVAEANKTAKLTDVSEIGYKQLVKETKAAARAAANATTQHAWGQVGATDLAAKVARHESLLKRVEEADKLRDVAKSTPLADALPEIEKRLAKYERIVAENPKNKLAASMLAKARTAAEDARLAALPAHADRILDAARNIATGKSLGKQELDAIVRANPSVQDQLVALAQSVEAAPGKAGVKASTLAKDSAELPSSRIIQQLNEYALRNTHVEPSAHSLSEAERILQEGTGSPELNYKVRQIIEEAGLGNEKLGPGGIRTAVAKEGLRLTKDDSVREAALASTHRKVEALKAQGKKLIPSVDREAMYTESLAEEVHPVTEAMTKLLEEGSGRRVALNVGGKEMGGFKPLAKVMTHMGVPFELAGKLGKRPGLQLLKKGFSIGEHFPEETNYIRQMAENSGTVAQIKWAKRVADTFTNKFTHAEMDLITKAIESGTALGDPRLEAGRQAAKAMRDEIFAEQVKLGKYVPSEHVENQVFHYYRGKNKAAINAQKAARKADMRAGLAGPRLSEASAKGLKPLTRIDDILLMQHRDYVTNLQRANFRQWVMSKYGVLTDEGAFANSVGIQEVSESKLNKMFMDKAAGIPKAKWYLPPEIHKTFKEFDNLMKIGSNPEADGLLGAYDKVVRTGKTMATIANPANWINNTFGDFVFNWMDNVKDPRWYSRSAKIVHGGIDSQEKVMIAGDAMKSGDLLHEFYKKAPSGGFIRNEAMSATRKWGTKGVKGVPSRFVRGSQNLYESREEWVRFAHFMHATDDEMRQLIAKGYSREKAFEVGTEAAAKRVSKYNIDYSGITPVERAIRKRYVPFYTFMRKAMPLMLEAMITRPGKLNHYHMGQGAIEKLLGVPPMKDDGTVWPPWTEEQGITRLQSGVNEPFYVRDPSPFNVVNRVLGGQSNRSPIQNLVNQIAPPIKTLTELNNARSLYNDRPIDSWGDWMLNQVPTASIIARAVGHPLSPQKTSGTESGAGTSIAERLSTIGLPVGKNTEARQQAELHNRIGAAGEGDIYKRMNASLEASGWKITKGGSEKGKNGVYWIVKDADKNEIGRYRDRVQAFLDIQDRLVPQG